VTEARNLLVAAARSTVQRRAQRPSGAHARQVQEYLRGVRLGRTEQGSFVVALLSPIEPPAAAEERQLRLPQTDPFLGRVVEMLADATDAAASTAQRVARGAGHLDQFHPGRRGGSQREPLRGARQDRRRSAGRFHGALWLGAGPPRGWLRCRRQLQRPHDPRPTSCG
jgi:hypothetical protein